MILLPIVSRELRVAARKPFTYWSRFGSALTVIIAGGWCFAMMRRELPPQLLARVLFGILTGTAAAYGLGCGIRYTADCLSGEKRDGTLGLLFLTDLKGYDVVLGKFVASSLHAFYGMLAILPVLAVPFLMGGVALGEFSRMSLVAVNTMFFSLAVGMLMSAFFRAGPFSVSATLLTILFFAAAGPAVGGYLRSHHVPAYSAGMFFVPSPGFAFYAAFDGPYQVLTTPYWISLGLIHAVAWVSLAGASLILPHSWQDRQEDPAIRQLKERATDIMAAGKVDGRAFQAQMLDRNAFFWLSSRARWKPGVVWTVLALMACGWFAGFIKFDSDWLNEGIYLTTGGILSILFKGWIAAEAGRQLAEDRRQGSLELLLSTPLSVRDILAGQVMALQRLFLAPILISLMVALLLMFATLHTAHGQEQKVYMCLWVGGIFCFFLDIIALFYVATWQAISGKNPQRFSSAAVARIIGIPFVVYACLTLLRSLATLVDRTEPSWQFFVGWWFLIAVVVDLIFIFRTRGKLEQEFRVRAAQQYIPRKSWFKRQFEAS
jgi:ABC-type Na+ efflux pump permease subunit